MNQQKTDIVVVLDRSGSMTSIASDMRGGFDSFVAEQQKLPGQCAMSLYQFDRDYDVVYEAKPIADVPPLRLEPRSDTALLDAVGRTIQSTGRRLADTPEDQRPGKVLFMVITDGQENASKDHTYEHVKSLVLHQEIKYGWQFVYLGADASAFTEGRKLGFVNNAQYSAQDSAGMKGLFDAVSSSTSAYRGGQVGAQFNIAPVIPSKK